MNIQEATKKSLNNKKMISRKEYEKNGIAIIPTNDPYNLMVIFSENAHKKGGLPGKGWQPTANDLIADDWFVTNKDYQNLILSM